MGERRGWTLRLGPLGTYRVTKPSERVRVGVSGTWFSVGWLIIRRLGRLEAHNLREDKRWRKEAS